MELELSVGDKIRRARKKRGLSQTELCKLAKINIVELNELESGIKNTSTHSMVLSDILEVDHVWLFSQIDYTSPTYGEIKKADFVPHFDDNDIETLDRTHSYSPSFLYSCPVPHSDITFSYIVGKGNSVFSDGTMIFCDPLLKPKNHDIAICLKPHSSNVYFYELFNDGYAWHAKCMDNILSENEAKTKVSLKSSFLSIKVDEDDKISERKYSYLYPKNEEDEELIFIGKVIYAGQIL